jgi:hypothetical protein
VVDPLEVLAHDMQARVRDQVVDVGHPAGDRVVDRDHAVEGQAIAHGGEGVLEGADSMPGWTPRQAISE